MDRFFAATILGGRLLVHGIPQWGPWAPTRFEWATEPEINPSHVAAAEDGQIWTIEGLRAALRKPSGTARARLVWIHESLIDEARRLWETSAEV
jgi:hypothetical protein